MGVQKVGATHCSGDKAIAKTRVYPAEVRKVDQHDAYAVARWLRRRSLNDRHRDPAMTERDREAANLEGWILGVM